MPQSGGKIIMHVNRNQTVQHKTYSTDMQQQIRKPSGETSIHNIRGYRGWTLWRCTRGSQQFTASRFGVSMRNVSQAALMEMIDRKCEEQERRNAAVDRALERIRTR